MIKAITAALLLSLSMTVFAQTYTPKEIAEYRAYAEDGDVIYQHVMGLLYNEGDGVPQDYAIAAKWYTKAAEQGGAEAQHNLALMYAMGAGVPQDYVMAYVWLNLSVAHGNENAKKNKGIIQERMTPAQIAEAQKLSRECLAKDYKNCG